MKRLKTEDLSEGFGRVVGCKDVGRLIIDGLDPKSWAFLTYTSQTGYTWGNSISEKEKDFKKDYFILELLGFLGDDLLSVSTALKDGRGSVYKCHKDGVEQFESVFEAFQELNCLTETSIWGCLDLDDLHDHAFYKPAIDCIADGRSLKDVDVACHDCGASGPVFCGSDRFYCDSCFLEYPQKVIEWLDGDGLEACDGTSYQGAPPYGPQICSSRFFEDLEEVLRANNHDELIMEAPELGAHPLYLEHPCSGASEYLWFALQSQMPQK